MKTTTLEVREHLGDILNRVALRHDEFIIERKGKALAALVPVERLEQMRRASKQGLLQLLDQQRLGPGSRLSDEHAMRIALEAQRSARESKPKARRAARG